MSPTGPAPTMCTVPPQGTSSEVEPDCGGIRLLGRAAVPEFENLPETLAAAGACTLAADGGGRRSRARGDGVAARRHAAADPCLPAAGLSIHARVEGAGPSSWEDPSFVQLWGPRYQVYVVAERDLPAFSLGRLPDDAKGRGRAEETAARLHAHLGGRRMGYGEAGHGLGINANSLRYGATTGTVLIRWEGARQPTVWTVPPPEIEPLEARLEL